MIVFDEADIIVEIWSEERGADTCVGRNIGQLPENILRNSDETVGRIAEYLSFPSQSYFGERFKRKYKMSPTMYRKYYKIRDFDE